MLDSLRINRHKNNRISSFQCPDRFFAWRDGFGAMMIIMIASIDESRKNTGISKCVPYHQADKTAASWVATRAGHQYLDQQSFYSAISRDHLVLRSPSIVGDSWQ